MCGILGVVNAHGGNVRDLVKYMQDGCVVGTLRGSDSTGMFQVETDGKSYLYKTPYSGECFASTKLGSRMLIRCDSPGASILHHRAATRGNVSTANAHPFEHYDENNRIIGVHNGTLSQSYNSYEGEKFEVDSDYLFYRIFKDGPVKTFQDVAGSYACVWFDEKSKTINLISNGERTIHIGFIRNKNAMLIASEHAMMYWLASRNSIELEDIISPTKNELHVFNMEGDLRAFTREEILFVKKPTKTREYHEYSPYTDQTYSSRDYPDALAKIGLSRGEAANFYVDEPLNVSAKSITGWIETKDNYVQAIIYGATPGIIEAMSDCSVSEVKVIGCNVALDQEPIVICSAPICSLIEDGDKQLAIITEFPEVKKEKLLPGPNGRLMSKKSFLEATARGCISCSSVITPGMAHNNKITWVNNDQDPLCARCSEDFLRNKA